MKTWLLAVLQLSLTASCDRNTLQENTGSRYADFDLSGETVTQVKNATFYTTKGITVKNSGAGPEAWSATNQYVPLLVRYADGGTTVANAMVRLRWAKVEDESGYHFERELDNYFLSAYRNKQKVCLGIFPLDSWTSNDVAVTASYNGQQRVAYIGYPKYIHQLLMQQDKYRPRLYQNYDGTITDASGPLYYAPDLRNPLLRTKYQQLLQAFRRYLDEELEVDGKKLCRRMLVREIQMRYWGYFGEGLYNYLGSNRGTVTITSDADPRSDMETSADLIAWGKMFVETFPDIRLVAPSNIFWQTQAYNEFQYWLATGTNQCGEFGLFYDMWGDDTLTPIASTSTVWNGQSLRPLLLNKWRKAPIGGEPGLHKPTASFKPYSTLADQLKLARPAKILVGDITGSDGATVARSTIGSTESQIFKDAYSLMGFRIIAANPVWSSVQRGKVKVLFYMQNIGLTPVYEPWDIYYVFRSASTNQEVFTRKSHYDIRQLMPPDNPDDVLNVRDAAWVPVSDDLPDVPAGSYKVYLRIVDPDGIVPNMRLSQPGYDANGEYFMMNVKI